MGFFFFFLFSELIPSCFEAEAFYSYAARPELFLASFRKQNETLQKSADMWKSEKLTICLHL